MRNAIDAFLNRITMYRLVLYVLFCLVGVALVLGTIGVLPYSPLALGLSALILLVVCWAANTVLVLIFRAPANVESVYITALILALIITPLSLAHPGAGIEMLVAASVLAMASKFVLSVGKKHIFNPVAVSVALTAIVLNQSASWWVATAWMLPFVLVGGALIVRKIRRWSLVLSCILVAVAGSMVSGAFHGIALQSLVYRIFVETPVVFFAVIMLTEPLTTPPSRAMQVLYGALAGFLLLPDVHVGGLYSTPELALVAANVFSYLVSPKQKLMLTLKAKIRLTPDTYDFVFRSERRLSFRPGQYMEWTLGLRGADSRGNRRYFTLASSPTEEDIRIGLKFYEPASSFKRMMLALQPGDQIAASQLAGEFVFPRDTAQRLVFIAGGIGITPFRSMVQYLLDTREKRDVVLLYSNRTAEDIVYRDVFDRARSELGMHVIYTLTDTDRIEPSWQGQRGMITAEMISRQIPDWQERMFYLSGPHAMVKSYEKTLRDMHVPRSHIKTDFFPGFA